MAGQSQPFKVIIAGGSVVGLILANALEKAGIDFIVLEKREIAPQLGASISVLPHAAKVFDQLGVWKTMLDHTLPLLDRQHFDKKGHLFEDTAVFRIIAERTKRPIIFMERQFYLQTLYDNLQGKDKVRDHTPIVSYSEDGDGVTVKTDKDEEIRGSILVGADGIHSTVRTLMGSYLTEKDAARAKNFQKGFVATYRAIFAISRNARTDDPSKPFMPGGMIHNVYYKRVSGVSAAGVDGLVFWFIYVKEDRPSTTPNCPRYTDDDTQDTINKYGHLSLGPGYTFNDLWESRVRACMVPLEEGLTEGSWNSGGRVVMMGDCVSKATISAGIGGNTHVEAVCNLVNELEALLKARPNPTTDELQALFGRYEKKQRPRAQTCVTFSGHLTRYEAMNTWYWRLARVISPRVPDTLKAKWFLDFIAVAPTLSFLPDPDKNMVG